jgi:hypothetical protein
MKLYELKLKKGGKGVFRVSLVKGAAVNTTLMKFKKESEEILTFADDEKRILYSVAMRPNIEIFRKDINGEPANVTYDEDFVEEAQINYFRNNGNKDTNIDHDDENTTGIFPFESWIVKDAKKDKSTVMGMETIDGDWILGYKVDNDKIWKKVKEGKLDGLSIEATNLDRILKEDTKMKTEKKEQKGVLAFVKEKFNEMLEGAEKMEGEVAEVSKWWTTVTNDTFALGDTVTRKPFDDEGEPQPVRAGEYELKDGRKILTDSEGVIRFIFDDKADDDTEEQKDEDDDSKDDSKDDAEKMEDEKDDDNKDDDKDEDDDSKDDSKDDDTEEQKDEDDDEEPTEKEKKLLDEIVDLKQTIAELKADKIKDDEDLEVMKAEVVKMKKQTPGAKKIPLTPTIVKHSDEAKPYDKMSNLEKLKFNREN